MEPWPSETDDKLMNALAARTGNRVVRGDSLPVGDAPVVATFGEPPQGVVAGAFWYDLDIPV